LPQPSESPLWVNSSHLKAYHQTVG